MIAIKLGRYLITRPEIANRLSNRIFPERIPQQQLGNYPRAIVASFSGNPDYSLSGAIADLAKQVQVDVEALTPNEAIEIAELIRAEIEYFHGTWDSTVIHSCTIQNERDQTFPPVAGDDNWIFRRSVDYQVTYER